MHISEKNTMVGSGQLGSYRNLHNLHKSSPFKIFIQTSLDLMDFKPLPAGAHGGERQEKEEKEWEG